MVLIDSCEALALAAQELFAAAAEGGSLAVDCEGRDLSRTGPLCTLQIATPHVCYVVDVVQLGYRAVASELKELLQDADVVKFMFDCRRDSDALFHQLGIRLQGVRDLQLKELMGRVESPAEREKSLSFLGKNVGREPHIYQHIHQLRGLKRCLADLEIGAASELELKQQVAKRFREDPDFWLRRPLLADAVSYAEQDTITLFAVDGRLPAVPLDAWMSASLAYESILRDSPSGRENEFLEHGFLPLHVDPGCRCTAQGHSGHAAVVFGDCPAALSHTLCRVP